VTEINGNVEPGWGKVADAFKANFDEGKEHGAAVAVYKDGEPVVDLWGGVADPATGRAWEQDSIVLIFSSTKGMTAILAAMLAERGDLDVDAPVAKYWPEFAANGKDDIPVRWLLSHQAGLVAVDRRFSLEEFCAWDPIVEELAAAAPMWEPGKHHAYHALTYGYLVGEVLRRITGRSVGALFQDEVAQPLGLSSWIGLPDSEESRVARITAAPPVEPEALQQLLDTVFGEGSLFHQSILGAPAGLIGDDEEWFGSRQVRAAEIPAGNLVSDARSLARVYAATIGEVDGIRLLSDESVKAASTVQTDTSTAWGMPPGLEDFGITMGLGFQLWTPLADLLGPTSFGHGGAGGSMGLAAPEHGLGFGYVMNRMLTEIPNRPRNQLIMDAVLDCLSVGRD
jgi:CubicO group peptidase (beta-lactamase class C family)